MIGLDLTAEEQDRVRFAMRHLRAKFGAWKAVATALGFRPRQVAKIQGGYKAVSPRMAFRVAKLAGVPVDDVLAGKFPPPGTCPHCGNDREIIRII